MFSPDFREKLHLFSNFPRGIFENFPSEGYTKTTPYFNCLLIKHFKNFHHIFLDLFLPWTPKEEKGPKNWEPFKCAPYSRFF